MTTTRSTIKSAGASQLDDQVDSVVSSIGPKVKQLRQGLRLSLQQLAVIADVSAAAIHKIERGDMVPTVTTLLKIATALGRPVSYFVEGAAPPDPVVFTRAAERPAVITRHSGLRLASVSGMSAPFRCAMAVATVDPGANSGDKPLVHSGEELVYVLDGTLRFEVAGTKYRLGRGDALHFIGDQPHRWANERKLPAHAVWLALRDS